MRRFFRTITAAALTIGLAACGLEDDGFRAEDESGAAEPIALSGEIAQVYQTRAGDSGFADKDEIGVYVVDYSGDQPGTLKSTGNRADNVRFTFDEAAYKWSPDRDIYWKDKTTHVDVYGYYPLSSIENVNSYYFEVRKDQSTEPANGNLAGYEASDFLWGKAADAAPTDKVIRLSFGHRLSGVRVSLVEGTGFASGEWASASKSVLILGTKRGCNIDLATGEATATGEAGAAGIIPYAKGGDFRAIVVPQEVAAGEDLISVTVGGVSYRHSRSEATVFTPSRQHNFTITVNKKAAGAYEFKMSDESITAWENDAVSHDATTREYVVINVETPGTLDKCIEAAGKDLTKVRNLKVTGKINKLDFDTMRDRMTVLESLNLKDVRIVKYVEYGSSLDYDNDKIPGSALNGKKSLFHLVLPDSVKIIGGSSFADTKLVGSIVIPEGVEVIEGAAFEGCSSLSGISPLPNSLKRIEGNAFNCCGLVEELTLPASLEYIDYHAFANCSDLYGELLLPDGLTYLGDGVFDDNGFSGSLVIPEKITKIGDFTFRSANNAKFDGSLILHDGITSIGGCAFYNCGFRGELNLPKDLKYIGSRSFAGCGFSGPLILPSTLVSIGGAAFEYDSWLSGIVEIPENLTVISSRTFAGCSGLEGVIIPASIETIQDEAFSGCFGINKIVCLGEEPPVIRTGAFNGVAKDNFTVEVPESAVIKYQTAPGWKDFKRISAYRNLSVSPSKASALNTKATRDLLLRADDEWIVESIPDWVTISQKEGKGKTELRLEFSQMPSGSGREGDLVFKLKDKDYRTTCHLTQYDYSHSEDEVITLQKATKGSGVNIVFLGDGFDAKDVSEGLLLKDINEAVGHFFAIEPYKTYKDYFNVYTAVSLSPESGVGGVNTVVNNRFNTYVKGGVKLGERDGDQSGIFRYACKAPTVRESTLGQTLIVVVANTPDYGGICYMYDDGAAIAYCPVSDKAYPQDFRGIVQHEAGGHGFGKLGDEYIYHNAFIDACDCIDGCGHSAEFMAAKSKGWYDNLSLTGKMSSVPWSHLLFNEKYSGFVDIYEGGYMHSRGVYRSESTSCMNNNIPYYSTISRESIVRRIMRYAGEEFSLEDFFAKDKVENLPETASTRAFGFSVPPVTHHQQAPVFMGKRPPVK